MQLASQKGISDTVQTPAESESLHPRCVFSVMKCLHMSFVDFFYSFVCTLISSVTVKFVFQNHSGNTDSLEKGFIVASFSIPGWIEISDQ